MLIKVVIVFRVITGAFNYDCRLCDGRVTCTDSVGDLGVRVDCKHCCIMYTAYVFSQSLKMLGFMCTYKYYFSTTVCFLLLYYALVRPLCMPRLSGIILRPLMPTCWNASREVWSSVVQSLFLISLIITRTYTPCRRHHLYQWFPTFFFTCVPLGSHLHILYPLY
jgi:hypothetical protein